MKENRNKTVSEEELSNKLPIKPIMPISPKPIRILRLGTIYSIKKKKEFEYD